MQLRKSKWGQGGVADRITTTAYDFGVEREWLARPFGWAMWGTDTRKLFESLRVVGDLPDAAAVLDIPCGGGVALRGLRPGKPVRYVAADVSVDMLARARRRAVGHGLNGIEFIEADMEQMPFSDGEFDLCMSYNGLHCLPDPATAVAEVARCLAPGGRFVGDSVVRNAGLRHELIVGAFRRAGMFGPGGTPDELRGWLTSAGLSIEHFELSGAIAHFSATR
jgi:SAM-dependent methyltransferase